MRSPSTPPRAWYTARPRTLALTLGLVPALPAAIATAAADTAPWNGSYAADGACYCVGALPDSTAQRFVPTPVGGQTISRVCDRLGSGPGLESIEGRFSHDVYPGPQCGNGPFAADTALIDADCAGTREPAADDCRPVGPRWNLADAYASAAVVPDRPSIDGTTVAASGSEKAVDDVTLGAALPPVAPTVRIAGETWRKAPPGTATTGGAANSRIILDGDVWLKADDPAFAAADRLNDERRRAAQVPAAATPPPERSVARAGATSGRAADSEEALRARQQVLVADARRRAAERRESGLTPDDGVLVESTHDAGAPPIAATTPSATPSATASSTPSTSPVASSSRAADPRVTEDAVAAAADQTEVGVTDAAPATVSALRLPIDARPSSSDFGYVQAMPVSYDIGGAGVMLEGSAEMRNRFHVLARAGIANKYQEVLLGGGMHYTPPNADRLTLLVTGGLEHGVFPLERIETGFQTDAASTGVFVHASGRLVLNPRFELEGGVGYSSFHEGDPIAFGGGFFHINDAIDLMSRFELGDQDSYGIGLRVYY